MLSNRGSGILLPISSIPSKYGIGCFSKEAYDFVDKLEKAGQKYWQILPLCPTSYGDSPYQSFSSFSGNHYFIDLEKLVEEGLLTTNECESFDFGHNERYIDYEKIYKNRSVILKIAFERWRVNVSDLNLGKEVEEYCLFAALKDYFDGKSWIYWDEPIKKREKETLNFYKEKLKEEVLFYKFLQLKFNEQWSNLKKYANDKNIKIIGDIPIYVALDSADSWSNPKLFQFDHNQEPIRVAGCPPDGFSADGQLWGNPLYDWQYHKDTSYSWWVKRMEHSFQLYDVVRVDHFRGFDEYYSIPAGETTARNGYWEKGPGIDLFYQLEKKLGKLNIIAEDLGFVTPSVIELLDKSGYPGMKVIEFAFDSKEESDYLPHNYSKNSIVYTGTHDNDTVVGWYKNLCEEDKAVANDYINYNVMMENSIHWIFVRLALSSVSNTAIVQIQDYLGLDSGARINTPSTIGENWKWRMLKDEFSEEIIEECYKLTKIYGRL